MGKKIVANCKALLAGLARKIPRLTRRLRAVVALLVVAGVFLFFLLSMNHSLRQFNGNYSGFVRLSNEFGSEGNPLFRVEGAPLLFENSDFEKGTLENWRAEDTAFQHQPTRGDNLSARGYPVPSNHQGDYWIGTYEKYQGRSGEVAGTIQGDMPYGNLTSTPFTIREERIAFLVGGGEYRVINSGLRSYVGLEIDGEAVLKACGRNSELMEMQVWDVKKWLGRTARIVVTDAHAPVELASFKHVNADYFHYYRENQLMKNLIISPSGYDGQFFYLIAFDPLLRKYPDRPRKYYQFIDEPAYRLSRIGFPLLIHAFSLGAAERFPRTMMGLILVSHLIGIGFLVAIIVHFGASPLWGFFYLLIPGFHVSLHTALPESISAALLLGGLYFYIRKRPLAALPFFAASILVRETGGLLVLLIVIFEIFKHRNVRQAVTLAGSFLPFLAWKLYLTWILFPLYGLKTLVFSPGDFTLPGAGFIDLFQVIQRGDYPRPLMLPGIFYPLALVLIFAFAVYFLVKKRDVLTLGFFSFSLLSLILNYEKIWCHVDNGVRTTYEAFLLLIVAFVSHRQRGRTWLTLLFLGLCALLLLYNSFFSLLAPSFKAGLLLSR